MATNPFADPNAPTTKPVAGNPFVDTGSPQATSTPTPGEQTNDVGNTVIVPKEDESFLDTMNRAAKYGKTVTQDQINAEVKTIPGKAATVLAAAPAVGVGGAAALTGVAEAPSAAEGMMQLSETALEHLAENYPQLSKLAAKLGYGVGAAGAYKLLNKLGIH